MMEYIDVKQPCPFCGGYDALYIGSEQSYNERLDKAVEEGSSEAALSIRCLRCNLWLRIFSEEPYWAAREKLLKKWERRKGNAEPHQRNG